ncbi:MAG: DUF4906 domain-containing protein [Duncaniella sp.]|uniref:DUF4906 domain-containing protein n=1 Tax=Duncaniella sp. TaxID=2518496 RepID=UPI0023BC34B4|nr:DUF4906 domain-containing protein [Duncaniella sp.]MDE5987892.1 DUF4906 domain-containing protein [Duncaniella sp.]
MKAIYSKSINILLLLLTGILSSCVDDFDRRSDVYVDGVADIDVELTYEAEDSRQLTSRAYEGGAPGDKIKNISSLVMLVYKGDNLYGRYVVVSDGSEPVHSDISDVKNSNDQDNRLDPDENNLTDSRTGKVSFKLQLQSAKDYYIYAVANMGTLHEKEYQEAILTRDGLKSISRSWDTANLANNSEMFGIFSLQPDRGASDSSPLVVSATTPRLHCWVRRLASKVTVAFDGSELYNDVQVYVTDIYLKDIPKTCFLGKPNTPGEGSDVSADKRHDIPNGVYEDGGKITVQKLPDDPNSIIPQNCLHLCNDEHSFLGAYGNSDLEDVIDATHANTAPSLFFYENMQGTGKSKQQDAINNDTKEPGSDNKIDFPNPDIDTEGTGWKDEKPFGTYVEVKGYYRCTTADGHVSSGPITYRFMLGQNVTTDYNATRNTHYQLTLAFKGYGNDADWHIEYKEKRGLYATSPQYISYLYNKKMVTTIKVVGRMKPGSKLKAHIIDVSDQEYDPDSISTWRPWGDGSTAFPKVKGTKSDEWPGISYYYEQSVHGDGRHQGFLSLQQTRLTQIPPPSKYEGQPSWNVPFTEALKASQDYYKEHSIGDREYEIGNDQSDALQEFGSNDDGANGQHTVIVSKRNLSGEPTERIFKIPLYTRAKELVTRTGYTGNNPYYSYPRKQKVRFTASIWKDEINAYADTTFILDIVQVRRIINPKGVWRKSGSTEDFHVTLLRLLEDKESSEFKDFISEGAWSAEVITGSGVITLSSTREGSGDDTAPQINVKRIQGATEKPIDFKINFTGADGCAIVRVRYHNYTCEHDIFCREGYDPIALADGTAHDGRPYAKWSSFNVDHFENGKAILTNSPLDEGSLFRRKCNIAITSANNAKYPRPRGNNRYIPGQFDVIDAAGNAKTLPWNEIKNPWPNSPTKEGEVITHTWDITNSDYQIANIEDYFQLMSKTNDLSFHINKAYGIVYGDGAREVKTKRSDAYGYLKNAAGRSEKGMIGVIVYNSQTAAQIFFPLGTEAAGRRKGSGTPDGAANWQGKWDPNPANRDYAGTLRYSSRSAYYGFRTTDGFSDVDNVKYQPMFYDLYRRPGAVYWAYKWWSNGNDGFNHSSAFEMNFFTMGFEGFQNGAATSDEKSDACFIRLVKK